MYKYDESESRKTERSYQSPEIARQRIAVLDALALRSGERVIDIGSGPGFVAREMALAVGAGGKVLGIDNSEAMVNIGRARCEGLIQVQIERADAASTGRENGSFDAAACLQVLLYVSNVDDVIAEMHRVVRPGGRIAIMETDWRGIILNSSDDRLTRRIVGAWDLEVASPNLPVRLRPMLKKHGFDWVSVDALPVLSTGYDRDGFAAQMLRQFAESAKKHEVATESETAGWLEDLERRGGNGSFFFCVNRFLFSAVKV